MVAALAGGINGGSRRSQAIGMCFLLSFITFYYYNVYLEIEFTTNQDERVAQEGDDGVRFLDYD